MGKFVLKQQEMGTLTQCMKRWGSRTSPANNAIINGNLADKKWGEVLENLTWPTENQRAYCPIHIECSKNNSILEFQQLASPINLTQPPAPLFEPFLSGEWFNMCSLALPKQTYSQESLSQGMFLDHQETAKQHAISYPSVHEYEGREILRRQP